MLPEICITRELNGAGESIPLKSIPLIVTRSYPHLSRGGETEAGRRLCQSHADGNVGPASHLAASSSFLVVNFPRHQLRGVDATGERMGLYPSGMASALATSLLTASSSGSPIGRENSRVCNPTAVSVSISPPALGRPGATCWSNRTRRLCSCLFSQGGRQMREADSAVETGAPAWASGMGSSEHQGGAAPLLALPCSQGGIIWGKDPDPISPGTQAEAARCPSTRAQSCRCLAF